MEINTYNGLQILYKLLLMVKPVKNNLDDIGKRIFFYFLNNPRILNALFLCFL